MKDENKDAMEGFMLFLLLLGILSLMWLALS
jgi:hypothetical protein